MDWRKFFFFRVLLWDCFVVDSVFSCTCCFGSCRVVQCLVWFEVFLFICWFFSMTWWNTITDFFPRGFFLWDFLCLVSLRWGRFFCWMNWIVCWLSCRRICFFLFQFFLMGLKKNFYSMKEVFYMSFFIYRKHGRGTNVKVNTQIFFSAWRDFMWQEEKL